MSGCNSRCGCDDDNELPAVCDIFPTIVTGQTLSSVLPITISDRGSALSRVYIDFKADPAVGLVALTLDSETDDINITQASAGTWGFSIMDFEVTLPAETYFYQLWTVDETGAKRCWITGTWEISTAI